MIENKLPLDEPDNFIFHLRIAPIRQLRMTRGILLLCCFLRGGRHLRVPLGGRFGWRALHTARRSLLVPFQAHPSLGHDSQRLLEFGDFAIKPLVADDEHHRVAPVWPCNESVRTYGSSEGE